MERSRTIITANSDPAAEANCTFTHIFLISCFPLLHWLHHLEANTNFISKPLFLLLENELRAIPVLHVHDFFVCYWHRDRPTWSGSNLMHTKSTANIRLQNFGCEKAKSQHGLVIVLQYVKLLWRWLWRFLLFSFQRQVKWPL